MGVLVADDTILVHDTYEWRYTSSTPSEVFRYRFSCYPFDKARQHGYDDCDMIKGYLSHILHREEAHAKCA